MGGTETMRIVAHRSQLFAALSYWTDQPGDDGVPGAQILVKPGEDSPWQVNRSLSGVGRVSALERLTFTTDSNGTPLDESVSRLVADAAPVSNHRQTGKLACFIRDDVSGEWNKSIICESAPRGFIRAFGFHKSSVGIEMIFAGTEPVRSTPASLTLRTTQSSMEFSPEFRNPDFDGGAYRRCQGVCVANEKLYASVAPRLLERVEGTISDGPTWREVLKWNPEDRAGSGLRGITAISSIDGDHEVILGSREQEGRILRIDPLDGYRVTD